MKILLFTSTYFLLLRQSLGFIPINYELQSVPSVSVSLPASTSTESAADVSEEDLGLTPELEKITNAFEAIGDDKLRYKQMLYMAGQLPPMDPAKMIPENKVIGCLSTVYVDGKIVGENGEIEFTGDSDGLLTKGLVALLIRGLSGNTAEQIQKVDPAFIEKAGIQSSLTPGRNNGFLNMLATMKKKAMELEASGSTDSTEQSSSSDDGEEEAGTGQPMYDGIVATLQKLKPTSLELTDVSHRHAGHAGMNGVEANESHFELSIVAEAFDGLNLVKRHQLIYMLLGEIMPKIHALQISALTPEEFSARGE